MLRVIEYFAKSFEMVLQTTVYSKAWAWFPIRIYSMQQWPYL